MRLYLSSIEVGLREANNFKRRFCRSANKPSCGRPQSKDPENQRSKESVDSEFCR